MNTIPRATLLTAFLTTALLGGGALNACGVADMNDSDGGAIDDFESAAPAEVLAMARSSDAAQLEYLSGQLHDEVRLHYWDHPDDYAELDPRSLALAGVLKELADNSSPEASVVLENLTHSPLYNDNDARALLLIEALGRLPLVTSASVEYWLSHTGAGSIFNGIVFEAASGQGSADAATVVGAVLKNDRIGDHEKIAWLRRSMVEHRNQEGLLAEAETLLASSDLSDPVRSTLIETLFDYRPDDWYAPDTVVSPPVDGDYSADARTIRARMARGLLTAGAVDGELKVLVKAAAGGFDF